MAKKTSLGLDENVEALLAYLVGWLSGLLLVLLETRSRYVRFHAMQSLLFFGGITVISMVPVIGWILAVPLTVVSFVMWIVLMYKAYRGERFKLPVVGDMAENWTK